MSWIGGDLGRLQAMGNAMKPAQEQTNDIVKALSSQVDKVVNDAGYSGDAATAFRKAWTATSIQVGGLATVTSGIGQSLGTLGDRLQQIEADLYNTAQEAKGRGAQISDDGKPLSLVITGDPDSAEAKKAREAQKDYTQSYNLATHTAQGYRLQAAKEITTAINSIRPDTKDGNSTWDQAVTIADYIRGLYAVPNEQNSKWAKELPDKIKGAQAEMDKAQDAWRSAHDAYNAAGAKLPPGDPAWLNQFKANKDLSALQTTLSAAESGKWEAPLSNALNVKIGDAGKLAPGLAKFAPESLDFLKDIPVVDVAASAGAAEIQAEDDIDKGQNSTKARLEDYGAAGIGLAAGAGVAAALGTTTAPVWGTALAAGGVVVGVGDAVYEGFHEHWGEDIHDRGVWNGTMHGLADTGSNTWGDVKGLFTSTGHVASSLWHKVF